MSSHLLRVSFPLPIPPVTTTSLLLCSARSASTGCPRVFFVSPRVMAAGKKEKKKPRSPGIQRSPQSPSHLVQPRDQGWFQRAQRHPFAQRPIQGGPPQIAPVSQTFRCPTGASSGHDSSISWSTARKGSRMGPKPRSALNYSCGAAEPQPSEDLPVHSRRGVDLQLGPAQLAACLLQTDPSEPAQVLPSTN